MLTASRVLINICTILSVLIVIEYALLSPAWKKTLPGRVLMSIFSLFALTLMTASLTIFIGLEPWVVWIRFFAYLALTFAFALIVVFIAAIQEIAYQDNKEQLRQEELARLREEEKDNGKVDHEPEDA